ncbi:MAG: AMP-binding protein [Gammaproteobacteria bacterium]|nr:MAG: AMP-binding protein [Gammaproteobacteria bacterium]
MSSYVAIEKLLAADRSIDMPVAVNACAVLDWQNWLGRVAGWRQLLPRSEQRWALYHDDAGEFAAILYALWSLGKVAYLPGNQHPALVAKLADQVDAFIGDFDELVETPTAPACQDQQLDDVIADFAHLTIDRDAVLLKVFTSGSSGEPQAIDKTLQQLSNEVAHLDQLWGHPQTGPSPLVLATVSHQHIYGLLFRVLWPLAAGVCFDVHACDYLEQIKTRSNHDQPLVLVSSPAHLSRIPLGLDTHAVEQIQAIFSSGAPLKRLDSLLALERFGVGVTEVYGSSETGGVAWRQQQPANEAAWQPMPGVQVRANNQQSCLELCSEHLQHPQEWYQTTDRVHIDEQGKFTLLGRVDRVVKVEGKRASLSEMENWLLRHPAVEAVAVLVLENQRVEIGAVIVLSSHAKSQLSKHGKRSINSLLSEHFLQEFERPLAPRRWRYVDQLPVSAQGKLEQQRLGALFLLPPKERPRLPVISQREQLADQHLRLTMRIPKDLLYFDGHFDEVPVLPGVVQIHWADHFARQELFLEGDFLRLEAIKFKQIIRPNQEIILDLSFNIDRHRVDFNYYSKITQYSSGRIVLSNHS